VSHGDDLAGKNPRLGLRQHHHRKINLATRAELGYLPSSQAGGTLLIHVLSNDCGKTTLTDTDGARLILAQNKRNYRQISDPEFIAGRAYG